MMMLIELLLLALCGLVMLLAAVLVLLGTHRAEVSLRAAAAAAVGWAGAEFVGMAIHGETVKRAVLLLALGVAIWIVRQMRQRPEAQMRRATDWGLLDD